MRALIQRVAKASIEIDTNLIASIDSGILALVGFHKEDTHKDMDYILNKILQLRIFNDSSNNMNLSLLDIHRELLLVSQFTLYGNARKGRRPSYSDAMPSDRAIHVYDDFVNLCVSKYDKVKSGVFGAMMEVGLVNSGPVTIMLDSHIVF